MSCPADLSSPLLMSPGQPATRALMPRPVDRPCNRDRQPMVDSALLGSASRLEFPRFSGPRATLRFGTLRAMQPRMLEPDALSNPRRLPVASAR
jgi:hypothetical protein